ncbi:MAG TPA: FadR/GntR family transcriptional regulator [Alphaproteobacteria bacterium]|nr:FadR/GntR family transcriptional regulator [Alphaproteobacteria bacterium]
MPIQPVETQRLYQQAADQIRSLVRRGEYAPGDRLPSERELAKRLGVSRPTVREAMIALEIAGIIDIRAGAGIFVSDQATRDVQALLPALDAGPSPFDLLAARRLLECEIAAQAAEQATIRDLAAIKESIVEMERDMARGGSGQREDRQFHGLIAGATRNSVFVSLVDGLWEGMSAPLFHSLSAHTHLPDHKQMTIADHRAIYEGLRKRDGAGARAAMAAHLAHVEAVLTGADDLAIHPEHAPARPRRRDQK